jgi:hypothetical protein
MLGYRPLVYFWIAEYTDGSALPQFDPETGKENKFSEVDQQKLKHFGWYPFSAKLAKRIMNTENVIVVPTSNPSYKLNVENESLLAYRTNKIKLYPHKGEACHSETVYVLGTKGAKVLQITEDGSVIDESS